MSSRCMIFLLFGHILLGNCRIDYWPSTLLFIIIIIIIYGYIGIVHDTVEQEIKINVIGIPRGLCLKFTWLRTVCNATRNDDAVM